MGDSNDKRILLAIGNSGSGKSTFLNSFAGKLIFKSGIAFGPGLTDKLEVEMVDGMEFYDTPGLSVPNYRDAVEKGLTDIFCKGGQIKIIFFVMQDSGRLRTEDSASMKLILESVPEIQKNYGVIVNKIPSEFYKELDKNKNVIRLTTQLFYGIKDEFKTPNILFVESIDKLRSARNMLVGTDEIDKHLSEFLNESVPFATISPDFTKKISINRFDSLVEEIEAIRTGRNENEEMEKMLEMWNLTEAEETESSFL